MLVQLSEIKQFLCKAIRFPRFSSTLVKKCFKSLILCRYRGQLIWKIWNAVVVVPSVRMSYKLTTTAPEYNRRAISLMFEDIRINMNLFAAAVPITALKFDLSKQVSRDTVDLIKLWVWAAKWAMVRVLGKPVPLAVRAYGLLTDLALQWVF